MSPPIRSRPPGARRVPPTAPVRAAWPRPPAVLLRAALFWTAAALPPAAGLAAQEPAPPLALSVRASTGQLQVRIGDILSDRRLVETLHSGLPLRIRFEAELWKDRFFDSQRGTAEWRATLVYEPLDRTYRIETSGDSVPAVVGSIEAAGRRLGRTFTLPLRPTEEGGFYYLGEMEVETLSASDLEELRRWLRGDLGPAVSGEEGVDDALGAGVRRLVLRVLSLPTRRFRARTETFRFGGDALPL